MQNEIGEDVRVLIQDEARLDIATLSEIEVIASRKYAARQVEPDGSVHISRADVWT